MVGVDSGQVIITDPCYIDSSWENADIKWERKVKDPKTKKVYEYGKDFTSYDEKILDNKSVNDLIASGKLINVKPKYKNKGEYSYRGCCETSIDNEKQGGQLFYKRGHAGAGVVASSGLGDGFYPVYAHYEDCGTDKYPDMRIKKLEIIFLEDE